MDWDSSKGPVLVKPRLGPIASVGTALQAAVGTPNLDLAWLLQRRTGPVKMWAGSGRCAERVNRKGVYSALLACGDLLNQVDDAPAQFGIGDAHECLGQRQAVRSG
jgi:hypothetical protein